MSVLPPRRFAHAGRHVGVLFVLAALPSALLAMFLIVAARQGPAQAIDFRVFFDAGRAFIHGRSPYAHDAAQLTWAGGAQHAFYYPPTIAALVAPFTMLPYHLAAISFAVVSAGAVIGALWLLEVRDWRVYGAVYLSPAILTGISVGTLSPLLLLGVAACWRWRNRASVVVVAVGVVVLAKLFLWPLFLWLWFTGRRRAALTALGATVGAALICWAVIGFAGLRDYAAMLRHATLIEGPHSYQPAWLLGGSVTLWAFTAVGAAIVVAVARRGRDGETFLAAICGALLVTPILWLHYLALLPVIAIVKNRFHWVWLLPAVLWVTPYQGPLGQTWRVALVVVVIAAVFRADAFVRPFRQWKQSRPPAHVRVEGGEPT